MATVDKTEDRTRIKPVNHGEVGLGVWECRKLLYSDFSASGDIVQLIDIPADSFIANLYVKVTTAFNGTTPVLVIGDGSDADGYLASGEIEEAAVKVSDMNAPDVAAAYAVKGARPFYTSADTLDVTFTYGGTPTAGEAIVCAHIVTIP